MTIAVGATLVNAACGVRLAQPPAASPRAIEKYTFPLAMPSNTLICVEAVPIGYEPCITLKQLREWSRDTEAN